MLKAPPALRRAAALLLVLGPALSEGPLRAEEAESGVELKYMYYGDRNGVWNHTPAVAYFKKLASTWKLRWDQELDYVSGASRRLGLRNVGRIAGHDTAVDAVSGASRRELRHSEKATAAYENGGRAASASFYFSDENDYRSYSPSVSGSWDFNQRNTTLSGSLAFFFDDFHPRGPFRGLGGKRRIVSASMGAAQVLTRFSLMSVSIQPIHSSGFLGHPYNPVRIEDGTDTGQFRSEELPDRKLSWAYTAKMVQGYRVADRLGSLHFEVRHYRDDWALTSNTADLHWYQYLAGPAWIRLRLRGYYQGAAAFARSAYRGDEVYRTPDIRYYAFSSVTFGAKAGSSFPEAWQDAAWLPDRWDVSYDHGVRDTRGEESGGDGPGKTRYFHYQMFDRGKYYMQGTLMAGLAFDL